LLETRDAYARWAAVYPARPHNALMRAEQRVMESVLGTIGASAATATPGAVDAVRALDVGTGTGRYRAVLARSGGCQIVGVDFSWEMLRAGAADPARGLVCGDATALPFADAAFDLTLASLMVGDISDLSRWVGELDRVLRPGGHLVYSDFHGSWAGDGWRRTLQDRSGRTYEIPYHARSVEQHWDALEAFGFVVSQVREIGLESETGPEADAFRRRWGNPPVAIVVHARRAMPKP
jgi:ubiquinone/menaquinone biosynthesis C-methylase UbiE